MTDLKEKELVIATHNKGKAKEIAELLDGLVGKVYTAGELGLSEPVEDGDSFVANALIKARSGAKESGKLCLADDSGLAVNALGGAPGIFSARWAGPEKDFNAAMEKVMVALNEFEDKSAAFICVLALCWPPDENGEGREEVFEGRVEGQIVWPARGDKGFGYDPIFVPRGSQMTFAEMEPEKKHRISHRAAAFKKLKERFL